MDASVQAIPWLNLSLAFLPVLVVVAILFQWSLGGWTAIYAVARMAIQLLLIGYLLVLIFTTDRPVIVLGVLLLMLAIASWISLRPLANRRRRLFAKVFAAIGLGGGLTLLLVTQGVLALAPWFAPRYVVPLAGMIFANAMNAVSLAAERFLAEADGGVDYIDARRAAMKAMLIPQLNSLFAVGLVSIPGMMTGQVLAGISPLEAVRYQIMVMCMIFGSAGISTAMFLVWLKPVETNEAVAALRESVED